METFAERVKELRIERGLSLEKLSKQIGIGTSSICRWENGQADVRGAHLVILSKFFGVTTEYLLGLED